MARRPGCTYAPSASKYKIVYMKSVMPMHAFKILFFTQSFVRHY